MTSEALLHRSRSAMAAEAELKKQLNGENPPAEEIYVLGQRFRCKCSNERFYVFPESYICTQCGQRFI